MVVALERMEGWKYGCTSLLSVHGNIYVGLLPEREEEGSLIPVREFVDQIFT